MYYNASEVLAVEALTFTCISFKCSGKFYQTLVQNTVLKLYISVQVDQHQITSKLSSPQLLETSYYLLLAILITPQPVNTLKNLSFFEDDFFLWPTISSRFFL